MSSKDFQIQEIYSQTRCTLAPSPIHGIGVFSIRDILKGERVYAKWTGDMPARWYTLTLTDLNKFDRLAPKIKQMILDRWGMYVVNGRPFRAPNYDALLICFMNHSENDNYDPKTDIALCDILAGEEITENYKNMPDWEKVFLWLN